MEWAHAVADGDDEGACELAARLSADPDTAGQFADSWQEWDAELREDCIATLVPSTVPEQLLDDERREDVAALTVDDLEVLDEPLEGITTFRLGEVGLGVDVVEDDGRAYVVWSRPALSTQS